MRILLVCESSYKFESGGRVVRFLTKILKGKNHEVKLLVLDSKRDDYELDSFYLENDVTFFPIKKNLKFRMAKLFLRTDELRRYKKVIDDYKPEIIHFASFDNEKPGKFIVEAKKTGAKVILQPWTMQFYCAQNFGFKNGHKCNLCVKGAYWHAIAEKCIPVKGIPLQIERQQLHSNALKADVFLSSNTELDFLLKEYGVKENKIARFPVPFDCSILDSPKQIDGEYFIFYGQANEHKGLDVLLKAFESLPNQKLRIYPLSFLNKDLSDRKNIEVINGKNWKNGLKEAIVNAKAVLVPSLWSTSTEYAMCEALLLKKPVVVFNVGVHKDIFQHKFNAMVIEPNDIESYRKAILELDEDITLRQEIAENGFNTLLKVNDEEKLYLSLISSYSIS